MILAHFTTSDTSSVALVFGIAFLFGGWRRAARGDRRRGLRLGGLGLAALAVGVATGFAHN